MESRKSRPLVDGGRLRRYFTEMYARPGRKLFGKMWYERHRDRKLLRDIVGKRNSAGVVGSEVDYGDRLKREAKGQDGCERVKLYDFRLCDIQIARTMNAHNAIES